MPEVSWSRITFNFTLPNSTPGTVVRHFDAAGGAPVLADYQAMGQAVEDWWNTNPGAGPAALTQFHSNTTLESVTLTQMAGAAPLEYVHDIGTSGDGTGDAPPNESAIVTTWTSGIPGRSFRGRSYWPGYDLDILDGTGRLAGTTVANWNQIMNDLRDALNTAGATINGFAVYSRTLDQMTPITGVTTRNVPHHQTRRNF